MAIRDAVGRHSSVLKTQYTPKYAVHVRSIEYMYCKVLAPCAVAGVFVRTCYVSHARGSPPVGTHGSRHRARAYSCTYTCTPRHIHDDCNTCTHAHILSSCVHAVQSSHTSYTHQPYCTARDHVMLGSPNASSATAPHSMGHPASRQLRPAGGTKQAGVGARAGEIPSLGAAGRHGESLIEYMQRTVESPLG